MAERKKGRKFTGPPPSPDSTRDISGRSTKPEDNLGLARWLADIYTKRWRPRDVDIMDTEEYGDGCLGLIEASKRFRPEKGFLYSTYAQWWIRRFIQEGQIQRGTVIRKGRRLRNQEIFFTDMELPTLIDATGEISRIEVAIDERDDEPEFATPIQRVWVLLDTLHMRERRVIFKKIMGLTLEEIGDEEDPRITRERVRQIWDRGIQDLRDLMRRRGIKGL